MSADVLAPGHGQMGTVGFRHGAGELVVVAGQRGRHKAQTIAALVEKLPPGSRFVKHEWPFHCHKFDIERDLRDGLYVFVDANDNLDRFPVRPFRLIRAVEIKAPDIQRNISQENRNG